VSPTPPLPADRPTGSCRQPPRQVGDGRHHARDREGLQKLGGGVCDLAERALSGAAEVPIDAVEVRRRDVYLPMRMLGFRLGRMTGALPRQLYGGAARSTDGYLLRRQDALDPEFAYERSMSPCVDAGELVRGAVTGR
jgi:hypothetical protein